MLRLPLRLAFLLAAVPSFAIAQPADDGVAASIEALTAQDVRAATLGYRLATGALALCPDHTSLPGMVVQDVSQYRGDLRPVAARLYNLGDGAAIVAVVPGGAAERAGLRARDRLVAIGGVRMDALVRETGGRADQDRITQIFALIERSFAAGPVRIEVERDGKPLAVDVIGDPGCASTIQVELGGGVNAGADGRIITVSRDMMEKSDDAGLAFVMAHELSHNILKHGAWLDAQHTDRGVFRWFGKNRTRILRTEMEADYHAMYVMAAAGFPLDGVPAYWRGMGQYGPGLFGDGTHLGNAKRVRFLQRAIAEVEAKRAAGAPLKPDFAAFMAAAANDG